MTASFLQKSRHNTVYYFRRRVPDDIQAVLGRRQIYKSLDTHNRREAVIRARKLAAKTDALFAYIRTMPDTEDISIDYSILIEFDERSGKPKKIQVEADSQEDREAAQKALETTFTGLSASAATNPNWGAWGGDPEPAIPAKSIADAIAEYLNRDNIKGTTKDSYSTKLAYLSTLVSTSRNVYSITQLELVELAGKICADKSRGAKTQGYYISDIAAFLNWHRIRGGLSQLTVKTLKPKETEGEERESFSLEETAIVLKNAAQYRHTEPAKFWVSVLAVFTGCRAEELCQINLKDDAHFDKDKGIWYFDLNETVDGKTGKVLKSIKGKAGWRKVPIHSALIKHGLMTYLDAQTLAGHTRPFEQRWRPHVGVNTHKWSHEVSKWGGRELAKLRKAGKISSSGAVYFHSWRNTLTDMLSRRNVSEEHRSCLLGQSTGKGVNGKVYLKLRQDHEFLSGLVEKHYGELAALLDAAVAA